MNDALLLMLIMVAIVAGLGWLSMLMQIVAIVVRDWRCDTVRRETEIETAARVQIEMAGWAIGACMQCRRRRHPAPQPIQPADRQAAVTEAERLMREMRGEGAG